MSNKIKGGAFGAWWRALGAREKLALAKRLKVVPNYLSQLSGGFRPFSVRMAVRLENAVTTLQRRGYDMPPIECGQMNDVCAKCRYYTGETPNA